MILWCAYCQKFQGETEPFENYAISHGICPKCIASGVDIPNDEFARILQLKSYQEKLYDAGVRQDHILAAKVIEAAQLGGVDSVDLLVGVMAPLLWKIGDLWEAGTITVADEHNFTSFFDQIIESIEKEEIRADIKNSFQRVDIFLINAPKNTHLLGIRVLNLWLRSKAINSVIFTEKYSIEAVIANIETLNPKFVGLSVAIDEHLPEAIKFCKQMQLHFGERTPRLLLGGGVVKRAALELPHNLGFVTDLNELLKTLRN